MNILQVTHRLYPSSGGGSNVVCNISKYLQFKGNNVTIITSDYNFNRDYINNLEDNGIAVLGFHMDFIFSQLIISRDMEKWLGVNIRDYDIIHLHGVRTYQNYLVIKYAKKYNIPMVLHPHGSFKHVGSKKLLKSLYDIFFLKNIIDNVSVFIALSESEKNACEKMGVPLEKINIVPNGIDLIEFTELPSKGEFRKIYGIPDNKKILLYIGRIDRTKGIDLLIKAYYHVLQEDSSYLLVIAGSDIGYKNDLLRLISNLGINRKILFLDYLSDRDKFRALVDSTIFITPKFYGFPITFVEACACGLPLITTDGGDYLEWINGYAGFCTKYDEKMLAESIFGIANDIEKRKFFSDNCREAVNNTFNWEKITNDLVRIYNKILLDK